MYYFLKMVTEKSPVKWSYPLFSESAKLEFHCIYKQALVLPTTKTRVPKDAHFARNSNYYFPRYVRVGQYFGETNSSFILKNSGFGNNVPIFKKAWYATLENAAKLWLYKKQIVPEDWASSSKYLGNKLFCSVLIFFGEYCTMQLLGGSCCNKMFVCFGLSLVYHIYHWFIPRELQMTPSREVRSTGRRVCRKPDYGPLHLLCRIQNEPSMTRVFL